MQLLSKYPGYMKLVQDGMLEAGSENDRDDVEFEIGTSLEVTETKKGNGAVCGKDKKVSVKRRLGLEKPD